MHKPRNAPTAFNPDKFLAAEAKKKAATASDGRLISLLRVIALGDDFKKALYIQLQKERPEFFGDSSILWKYAEGADVLEGFLKRSLAKEKLKLSDDVFRALYLDFLRGLALRSAKNKSGDAPDSTNEEGA